VTAGLGAFFCLKAGSGLLATARPGLPIAMPQNAWRGSGGSTRTALAPIEAWTRRCLIQFVENVEAIIAEEQQVYWQNRGGQDGGARQAVSMGRGKEPEHT
jgi:hypothetical protein